MINVSNEFISRAENNPNYLYTLKITLKDGTILNLENKDIIYGGITIDEAVSEDSVLSIGAAIISSLSVLIDNRDEVFEHYNFKDAQVELTIGLTLSNDTVESFKRGTYTVVTADYNGSAIKLTCYDNIYKLEKQYIESTLAYPATVNDIIDDICELCGIELEQGVNLHFGNTVIQKNPADLTTTCRSIISYIAQINCKNVVCTPDGKLNFVWYSNGFTNATTYIRVAENGDIRKAEDNNIRTTEVVLSEVDWNNVISINGFFERTLDRFDTLITGVRILLTTDTDVDAVSRYISGSDEYLITLENNPIITEENVNTILTYVSSILINFYYRKGRLSHIGFPYITAGDVAEIIDAKGQIHICLVSATTFTAGQRQRTTSSGAAPAAANGAQYSNSTKQYIKYIKGAAEATAGLFETQIVDQSTQARTIYLHNRPQLADSDIQIKVTSDGLMVTANGTAASPTWYGLTVDGNLIANILQANGINADWINTGALVIYDDDNNEIFRADKSGKIFRWNMEHSQMTDDGDIILRRTYDSDEGGDSSAPAFTSIKETVEHGLLDGLVSKNKTIVKYGDSIDINTHALLFQNESAYQNYKTHNDDESYATSKSDSRLTFSPFGISSDESGFTYDPIDISWVNGQEGSYLAICGRYIEPFQATGATGEISSNDNISTYITPGNYLCPSAAVAATLSNAPFTDESFQLLVYKWGVNYCRCQVAWKNSKTSGIRYRICDRSGSWGSWMSVRGNSQKSGTITIPNGTSATATATISISDIVPSGATVFNALVTLSTNQLPYVNASGQIVTWISSLTNSAITISNKTTAWSNYSYYVTVFYH